MPADPEVLRVLLADKLEAEMERVKGTFGTLEYCTHMTFVLPPADVRLAIAALRASGDGGEAKETGSEIERISSFGFARGTIVREAVNGPNMLVVRGLGERTVVIVIEGDEGGQLRLRERPTMALRQVLVAGDYAEMKPHPADWEPPALTLIPHASHKGDRTDAP